MAGVAGAIGRSVSKAFLELTGFRPEGEKPPGKCVLIAAPHTSNWDFPYTLALASIFGVHIRWAGKHTLFRFPFGPVMRGLGGVAIKRDERQNRVESLARLFDEHEDLVLVIAAEGTRKRVDYWKSGFYRVAQKANVPIVCGYLDFERKRGGFGLVLTPTGDVHADMERIRAFYADKVGRHPEQFGPVRLREEEPEPATPPVRRRPPV
jgi:1-acyl-sn-glycerol-3-phosphate acyltransferase